jgi:hypothetical protein
MTLNKTAFNRITFNTMTLTLCRAALVLFLQSGANAKSSLITIGQNFKTSFIFYR